MPMTSDALPVLDLARLEHDRADFLSDLRDAARTYGFFYLAGHGVPPALVQDIHTETRRFFALPERDKLAIEMIHSPHFRGYTQAGRELTRGLPDWREQADFGAERPTLPRQPGAPAWRRLQGPNQWPTAQPTLRPVVEAWQSACHDVALRLLRAFSLALGQPEDVFDPSFSTLPIQHLKIIRYPGRDQVASDQGVGPHKDAGFLTLLLQDERGGLEVETAEGWLAADPIPGTFVVNIGESLELASNGYLRATVHRVVSPLAGWDRTSIAYFPGARLDATIPLLRLPPELAAEARGPETDPANPLFRDVGNNLLKGRLRSHPDVAERYYADVLAAFGLKAGEPSRVPAMQTAA
jgi:isopenicillin N synthase-like dioxygenase